MRLIFLGPGSRGACSAAAASCPGVRELLNTATKQLFYVSMRYKRRQINNGMLHGRGLARGSLAGSLMRCRPWGERNQTTRDIHATCFKNIISKNIIFIVFTN
jgi:hypothetical protein